MSEAKPNETGTNETGTNETQLCALAATELARRLREREVSAVEVTEAHLRRMERVDPLVNAVVTRVPELALQRARAADETLARALAAGEEPGLLHGLPVAHKDLHLTRGIRTTYGSPIFADFVPEEDSLLVGRLRSSGAIALGKTNTPEFGAGSQTFNSLFGATVNPYDTAKTCGGSSGGAAVALACGMVALADGSDMGGSLRNPAAFCNVVGLRPAPGRVPAWPAAAPYSPLSVEGPMGRTVEDVALMLAAISGPDVRAPLSVEEPGRGFDPTRPPGLDRDFEGVQVAWSPDLGGLPFDPRITAVFEARRTAFEDLGCRLEETEPDLSGADEVFKVWRAWQFELSYGGLLDEHREQLKETVIWNIEAGRKLTGPEVGAAERGRAELYHRVREFMEEYEFLILPTTQVPPFPFDRAYITEIAGQSLDTYIDWMRSCYYITVTGLPAISVPGGFTPEGLPVGIQIVGRHRSEFSILQLAHAFEQSTRFHTRSPLVLAGSS